MSDLALDQAPTVGVDRGGGAEAGVRPLFPFNVGQTEFCLVEGAGEISSWVSPQVSRLADTQASAPSAWHPTS